MTTPPPEGRLDTARCAIRDEILRWNPVMNLVSRQDSPRVLDRLLDHCTAGFHLVEQGLATLGIDCRDMCYVDVGAGNGLPGLLWAAGFAGCGGHGPYWLVEPRKRRAWFLARVARQEPFPDIAVVAGRWGDLLPGPSSSGAILISMKALRLTEPEVLEGLEQGFGSTDSGDEAPQRVVIVRFLGPEPVQDAEMAHDLQVNRPVAGSRWQQTCCQNLEGPAVRLLLTAYSRA